MSTSNAFEAEIDRGLESVSDAVRNIKLMSLEMGGELETHSSLIRSIDDKVSVQTEKIGRINKKLNKIK